jgi:hypothetical protein
VLVSNHGEMHIEQNVFLVEKFIGRKILYHKCVCKFHWPHPDSLLPSKLYV